ncbi:MAG: DnaB-like helicase C-terminal domain-containing protein [Candidatus Riflebacteria bacterium]|nr:DnaB-like helicase C-terminal domain-containing protein [Candidatus Riflebacteria bacterium]
MENKAFSLSGLLSKTPPQNETPAKPVEPPKAPEPAKTVTPYTSDASGRTVINMIPSLDQIKPAVQQAQPQPQQPQVPHPQQRTAQPPIHPPARQPVQAPAPSVFQGLSQYQTPAQSSASQPASVQTPGPRTASPASSAAQTPNTPHPTPSAPSAPIMPSAMPQTPPTARASQAPQMPSAKPSAEAPETPAAPANEFSLSQNQQSVKKPIAQTSGTEQKEIEKKVFTSDVTGYGDEDLEVAILSGVMKDSYILESLKGKGLMAGLFSTRFSRAIYQSILSLREESPELSALDKIVLRNKMRQMNLLDSGAQTLIDKIIAEIPPNLDQAIHYLELMKDQALKRKLKEVSFDIVKYIDKPEDHKNYNIETFTNKIIHDVRNIQKARTTKRINLVKEEMHDIMEDIERREREGEVEIIGYSCEPMHYLCQAISGFRKGFMYAIAGAPRRGKTTFTLELATRVATLNRIPVLFFTYEQTKKNLTYRLLAKESRLNPDSLQRKKIYSDIIAEAKFSGGWKRMQEYMDYFYIVEATKEDTVDRIRSYAYNAMQDFNTENLMIFVDYIQKMPLSRNYNDEKFKIEEISTELKALSIELNNPIMTISSLSKEGCLIDATESEERPTMYHCKGSGDLEYDLDCAMIQAKDWGDTKELYEQLQQRAEQLGKDPTRIPKVDVVNLFLDKNRDAPEGIFSVIQYLFFIEDNKFVELGPKFDDDRYRFGKIEELIDRLIAQNFIIFFDKPKDTGTRGRATIQLKNF